jgi:hypothetical protein
MNVILKAVIVVGACIGLTGTVPEPVQAFACGKCDDCIGGHTNPFSQSDKESWLSSRGLHRDVSALNGGDRTSPGGCGGRGRESG